MLIASSLLLKCAGHMLPLTHPLNKDTIIHIEKRERECGGDHTLPDLPSTRCFAISVYFSLSLFSSIYREIYIKMIYLFSCEITFYPSKCVIQKVVIVIVE